ncbi:hypothetical protein WMY93_025579 [Mugilogobius chulae]|uniref:DUF4371 domain-containing protein n=1 Tax=Mugilogobius chulae TaxID=88201 RepID=A0AAW0N461_9GOBI
MDNCLKLALLGKANIATQLDDGHRLAVKKHNEEVDRNRYLLSKLIDCVKFCGAFELALRGHDETEASINPGIFGDWSVLRLPWTLRLRSTWRERRLHLEEVKAADFIAIQADETSDVSVQCQLALVLRYLDRQHMVQERFYEFVPLDNANAESIAEVILERLNLLVPPEDKAKVIAQAYDGASVMRGTSGGVQRKIMDIYHNAHYVHCYAHQLNLIMQQATSKISKVAAFFRTLVGFVLFFKITKTNDSCATRWNFHSRSVNTVYEHKDDLLKCFETIRDSGNFDAVTVREAGGFVRMLGDSTFCFLLQLFHKIMPHVDMLFQQLQKRNIDPVYIKAAIQRFTDSILSIRSSMSTVSEPEERPAAKRQRTTLTPAEQHRIAIEVCDTILMHTKERFTFTQHLVSSTLLHGELFSQHAAKFPDAALVSTLDTASSALLILAYMFLGLVQMEANHLVRAGASTT